MSPNINFVELLKAYLLCFLVTFFEAMVSTPLLHFGIPTFGEILQTFLSFSLRMTKYSTKPPTESLIIWWPETSQSVIRTDSPMLIHYLGGHEKNLQWSSISVLNKNQISPNASFYFVYLQDVLCNNWGRRGQIEPSDMAALRLLTEWNNI